MFVVLFHFRKKKQKKKQKKTRSASGIWLFAPIPTLTRARQVLYDKQST